MALDPSSANCFTSSWSNIWIPFEFSCYKATTPNSGGERVHTLPQGRCAAFFRLHFQRPPDELTVDDFRGAAWKRRSRSDPIFWLHKSLRSEERRVGKEGRFRW